MRAHLSQHPDRSVGRRRRRPEGGMPGDDARLPGAARGGRAAWHAAVSHPMVLAIADGSLPHATFHRYFTQNVLYLEEYARAIGLDHGEGARPRCYRGADRGSCPRSCETEIPANLSFLERLGGSPTRWPVRGTMLPTTYGYTRHLLSTCALGDCAEGLTAVLAVSVELRRARASADRAPSRRSDLRRLDLGCSAPTTTTGSWWRRRRSRSPRRCVRRARMASLAWIFERSTQYEVAFWDMAYGSRRRG